MRSFISLFYQAPKQPVLPPTYTTPAPAKKASTKVSVIFFEFVYMYVCI